MLYDVIFQLNIVTRLLNPSHIKMTLKPILIYVALTAVPKVILTVVAKSAFGTEPAISNPKSLVVDEYVLIQTLTMFTFL